MNFIKTKWPKAIYFYYSYFLHQWSLVWTTCPKKQSSPSSSFTVIFVIQRLWLNHHCTTITIYSNNSSWLLTTRMSLKYQNHLDLSKSISKLCLNIFKNFKTTKIISWMINPYRSIPNCITERNFTLLDKPYQKKCILDLKKC